MGGDLSGRNGSGTEKYFPAEKEAMERAAKKRHEKEAEIHRKVYDEIIEWIETYNDHLTGNKILAEIKWRRKEYDEK